MKNFFQKTIDKIPPVWYNIDTIKKGEIKMINIKSILKLKNNDGLTLKMGKKIIYKTGWQVATEGVEVKTPKEAINVIKAYGGNCGVWFSDGVYYIDKSHRVNTKHEALKIGREHNQISVLNWKNMELVYC